jgi:transcriptional regulator with XRE-family HTH domain
MTGHRSFSNLTKKFSPERRARIATEATELRAEMELAELREALHVTQTELSKALKVRQPAVAKLEKRGDMHVSNVKRYVEGLGGTLVITATIKGRSINLTNALTRSERSPRRAQGAAKRLRSKA